MIIPEKYLKNPSLPNYITIGRMAAVPVVMVLIHYCQGGGHLISALAAVVFLAAALSDLVDGHLARKYKLESNLGRFLDPLADKLLITAAMVMLIPLGWIPAWVVVLIIAREMAVTGLRGIAVEQGLVIAANAQGKQKTLAQNIALFCLIWHYPLLWARTDVVGTIILYVALVLTYTSAFSYFYGFYKASVQKTSSESLAAVVEPAPAEEVGPEQPQAGPEENSPV